MKGISKKRLLGYIIFKKYYIFTAMNLPPYGLLIIFMPKIFEFSNDANSQLL